MKSAKEVALKAAEFDHEAVRKEFLYGLPKYMRGARFQHAQDLKLITQLAEILDKAMGALNFYANGEIDLAPRPGKEHLYIRNFSMGSSEWLQRSMSDFTSGKRALYILESINAKLEKLAGAE